MYLVTREDYLAHHGVRKQKWGVRNGPPYHLDRTDGGKISKKQQREADKTKRQSDRRVNKANKILKKNGNYNLDNMLKNLDTERKISQMKTKQESDELINWVKQRGELLALSEEMRKVNRQIEDVQNKQPYKEDPEEYEVPKELRDEQLRLHREIRDLEIKTSKYPMILKLSQP